MLNEIIFGLIVTVIQLMLLGLTIVVTWFVLEKLKTWWERNTSYRIRITKRKG